MAFENRQKTDGTPLSISIYAVKDKGIHMHDAGMLEIIFCLTGTITFSYAYEEFTLNAGEFVSVDRDAYYLHSDGYNMCASFYIDLTAFEYKYPKIRHQLFVCEGFEGSTAHHPPENIDKLRGKLITILKILINEGITRENKRVGKIVESIADMFVYCFDIVLFHTGMDEMSEEYIERFQDINAYLDLNYNKKITLNDMSAYLGLSSSYLSEFMLKKSIGFSRFIAYMRANKSEWFLINTNRTIVEISEECGFSDPQYYYKAFKEWYKCTPKQFRDKYVKKSTDNMVYYELHVVGSIVDDMMVKHYINMFEQ